MEIIYNANSDTSVKHYQSELSVIELINLVAKREEMSEKLKSLTYLRYFNTDNVWKYY